ncbi:major facilitator superfamily transporter [Hypoxylon sp. FL1150]|nr:major facilitator superfamily transporter [Hypoxylon sp. FL1150]
MSSTPSTESASQPLDSDHALDVEKGTIVHKADVEQGGEKTDPNIMDWDRPDDLTNPQNWRAGPTMNSTETADDFCALAAITLFSPFASSIFAPGVPADQDEFDNHVANVGYLLCRFHLPSRLRRLQKPTTPANSGPLVLVPLADVFGRVPIYHVSNTRFVVFAIACAVSVNFNMLISFRFLAGLVGSAPLTVGGGTLADVMHPQKRGLAIVIWNLPLKETDSMNLLDVGLTMGDRFLRAVVRPTPLPLFHYLYLSLSPSTVRLTYIGSGIGMIAGMMFYGRTARYHTHWAVPLLGTFLIGFGFPVVLSSIAHYYLIDTFTICAASAMAAIVVSRSIFAATFPLSCLT